MCFRFGPTVETPARPGFSTFDNLRVECRIKLGELDHVPYCGIAGEMRAMYVTFLRRHDDDTSLIMCS